MKLIKIDDYWIILNNKADEGINPEVKFFDDKVANPTGFWDTFALGGHVIKKKN